ncbi:MAG: hypothetical protein KDE51_28245 [Anaerolineales bacterium]|nr:hypothetical protein [Anaerolineales bacterium]
MMATKLQNFIGPRVPADIPTAERWRYWLPSLLFSLAAVMLIISLFVPYWSMTLEAPQYPKGLHVTVYVNEMTGDVAEIDGLNHYIGMRPLDEAAQLERSISIVAITLIAMLALAAVFVHTKWVTLLAVPAATVPFVFIGDMYFWLRNFGLNLDPTAPLSSAVKPFVPPVLGEGMIAQFRTIARPEEGLMLATAATVAIVVGLYFHRRMYKPLVDAQQNNIEAG